MPLFFSQSPYSFKPVPVLQHSPETNQRAFRRHFTNITSRYGNVQIALLVDKKGGESEIGRRYEENTMKLNAEDGIAGRKLGFEWFDFHAVCRGMKFENVSLLMDTLDPSLKEFGETVELDSVIQKRQSGILRTNCMDCLDRTNVVQSATAQRTLEKQLKEEGIEADLLTDTTTQWFNTLWADNGDAISRQYANTAALKGDFTRTRQRNYRGAINDLGLTLSRYYNNIVNGMVSTILSGVKITHDNQITSPKQQSTIFWAMSHRRSSTNLRRHWRTETQQCRCPKFGRMPSKQARRSSLQTKAKTLLADGR